MSLEWLKIRKRNGEELEEQNKDGLLPLEQRARQYLVDQSSALSRAEEGHRSTPDDNVLRDLLRVDWWLVGYQFLIATGMGMIVAGYVGCFSIVGKTNAPGGPSIWFALEASLSLLRIALWGWNVSWDEGTRLIMKLELHSSRDPYYPLITSPHTSEELGFEAKSSSPKPFTVFSEAEFFATASSWIGPVQRLGANAVTLYYAMLVHRACKDLSVTILLTDSRSFTFLCHGHDTQSVAVFSSTLEIVPGAGLVCYQVILGHRVERENDGFLRSQLFYDVLRHTQTLRARLFTDGQNRLDLRWNLHQCLRLTSQNHHDETRISPDSTSLSAHDKEYMGLRELWNSAASDSIRNRHLIEVDATDLSAQRQDDFYRSEVHTLFETSICEIYIWTCEREFSDSRRMHEKLSLQLHPECYRAMEARFTIHMQGALSRYQKYGWDDSAASQLKSRAAQLKEAWAYLRDTLRKLRSHAPNDLQRVVQGHFQEILCQGFECENLVTELGHLFLPPSIHGCLDDQIPRDNCVSSLCFALETVRNTQPYYFDSSPYHMVEQARGTLNLPRLRRNKDLCALDIKLDKEKQDNAKDYLNSIVYPDQTSSHAQGVQMTTLIFSDCHNISPDIKGALTEHITDHPNILYLAGTECPCPGDDCEEPHCNAILVNREAWKASATQGTTFAYRVGFEGRWDAEIQSREDHIQVDKFGRCLILFYCPDRQGKITVTLSVRNKYDEPIVLKSTLMSDMDDTQTTINDRVIPHEVEQGEEPKDAVLDFWDVRKGVGKIEIREASNRAWEVHGIIEVQWMDGNEAGSMNRAQAGECRYLVTARSRYRRLVTASVATR
ncbi:hypothetical protein VNI00_012589 [Paramarasmius palmivorus]|uniref:Uncharacterized protein n=1 Tax=Paramarasmius palmivorus TaxID=297713 RepID=A0AAW0C5Z7_9AGAR